MGDLLTQCALAVCGEADFAGWIFSRAINFGNSVRHFGRKADACGSDAEHGASASTPNDDRVIQPFQKYTAHDPPGGYHHKWKNPCPSTRIKQFL